MEQRHLRAAPSISSDETLQPEPLPLGSITPRVWTRPLRRLTPRTSYGYAVIHFAATVLGRPLDPWQQWLVIHLGEMLDDGRPRFRQVLVIVARQNGKTHLCTVLALFWMFVERWPLVFGTSTDLEQAKDSWQDAVAIAEETDALALKLHARHKRVGNGQQEFWTVDKSKYRIAAANSKGGRGKRIDRAIGDELREQHTWDAYLAAYNAMNARPRAQVVYITNMGDARSVVLNQLRRDAVAAIETPEQRPVGIFEWSAPPGSHPTDVHALAAANPQFGRRNDVDDLIAQARRVSAPGADPQALTGFLTEIMCMAVDQLDPAINPQHWAAAADPAPLDAARGRLAACVDVAPDMQHVTLAVAALEDDDQARVRVEVVHAWSGPAALAECLAELPGWIVAIRPRQLGWFPGGPAATLDATLRDRRKKGGRTSWPPRGTAVAELSGDAPAVCMGFSVLVTAGGVVHSGQPLLNAQIDQTEKLHKPDEKWVFGRSGTGHVDAVYAAAGAVQLARTMAVARPTQRRLRTPTAG